MVILLIFVSPVILIAAMSYMRIDRDLTTLALSRRQSLVYLASATVKGGLDRLKDIGVSLATRVRFRQLVGERRWAEAIEILKDVPRNFPWIERVFLVDPHGTLMADAPALPGVRGRSFAQRDWYQGVSRAWDPYVSEVYKRTAQPRVNVFAVAVPTRAESGTITGVLVLQVRLGVPLEWIERTATGPGGLLYVVDQRGRLAARPGREADADLVDLSVLPAVQKALRGEHGIEILRPPGDHEERIYAYEPVPDHGWGVVSEEPVKAAFAARDLALRSILSAGVLLVLFSAFSTRVILRSLVEKKAAEERIMRLNQDLSRRAAELDATNKELEAFSYSVSHDLRAPLRSIDGFSHALLEDCGPSLSETGTRHVQRVRAAAERMGQLIDDLLDLSRLTRAEMRPQEVDLTGMAKSIADELRRNQPERRVTFSIAEGACATGDRRLLLVALENLLGNAWKFTRNLPVAHIEFGMTRRNGSRAFFVRDDGAGFDMEYAGKLFGPFQRLHSVSDFEGTGIGLATVARIVRRHGGRVWAEGAQDRGATFYFTL